MKRSRGDRWLTNWTVVLSYRNYICIVPNCGQAVGADEVAARSALRFSLGHTTTEADVDLSVDAIAKTRAAVLAETTGRTAS